MSEWITRRARKRHQCSFCAESIEAGARYVSNRLTPWDHPDNDGFFTWRAHPFCLEVWNEVAPDWNYEWAEDTGEFTRAAEYTFPERASEYPWLLASTPSAPQGAEGAEP